jgi:3'-5' exoribonuclease
MNFHHAFVGGLLEHTLNAMEVADAVCKFYPKLNRDLVVAGIFLHDLAKTWELSYENAFSYTDGGQLVGHIVKGAIWVEKKAQDAEKILGEPIPRPLIDVIQHIILSHHGEPEFGAARVPSTPEAIVVHVIENLDAKLMPALAITRGDIMSESNWTDWQKVFNGRLYRPDVAPADIESEDIPSASTSEESPPVHAPVPGNSPPASQSAPKMKITNPLFESSPARKH